MNDTTYLYQLSLSVEPEFPLLASDQKDKKQTFLDSFPNKNAWGHDDFNNDLNDFFSSHNHIDCSLASTPIRTKNEAKQTGRKWAKLFYNAYPNTPFNILVVERNIKVEAKIRLQDLDAKSYLHKMQAFQQKIKGVKFDRENDTAQTPSFRAGKAS